MHPFSQFRRLSAQSARARLAAEFPTVPPRVIDQVLTAYRREMPTLVGAVLATRDRIEDARAMSPA